MQVTFSAVGNNSESVQLTPAKASGVKIVKADLPCEVAAFFPRTEGDIQRVFKEAVADAQKSIDAIMAIPKEHRNFDNTFYAADAAQALFYARMKSIWAVFLTHKDKETRECAQNVFKDMKAINGDLFEANIKLYEASHEAITNMVLNEVSLGEQRSYFLEKKMRSYIREGLQREEDPEEIKHLKCMISELESAFRKALNEDKSHLWVELEALEGLSPRVIESLQRNGDLYKLTCDYPVYFPLMETCHVEKTRQAMYQVYTNRGGQETLDILQDVILARDRLAHRLGYRSFAEYDIEDQMAGSVERVHEFLDEVTAIGMEKAKREIALLLKNLPDGVSLTDEGKIKPWDYYYILESYTRSHLKVNEREIQEYFPLESTLDKLFQIYTEKFNLAFTPVSNEGLWDPSARMYAVNLEGGLVGHLILDLFPREGKYSHACCEDSLSPVENADGDINPGIAVVLTNFTQPGKNTPSLLEHKEVETLFHELGHALHQLLGSASMPSLSGYHTLTDFLELPSQLLEEIVWEPQTLKFLSRHYQTGAPLPDDLINKKIASRHAFEGLYTLRQMVLANMSLEYFKEGETKDTHGMRELLNEKIRPFLAIDPMEHSEGSFTHLLDYRYAAKYYSYHWTQVFAKDVYAYLKENEDEQSERWLKYRKEVLEKGGGSHPDRLLLNLLGRPPSTEAFRRNLMID